MHYLRLLRNGRSDLLDADLTGVVGRDRECLDELVDGATLLMHAVARHDAAIVRVLLSHGASVSVRHGLNATMAIHDACRHGRYDVVLALLDGSVLASDTREQLTALDGGGRDALHYLLMGNDFSGDDNAPVADGPARVDILDAMAERGVSLVTRHRVGGALAYNPFVLAVRQQRTLLAAAILVCSGAHPLVTIDDDGNIATVDFGGGDVHRLGSTYAATLRDTFRQLDPRADINSADMGLAIGLAHTQWREAHPGASMAKPGAHTKAARNQSRDDAVDEPPTKRSGAIVGFPAIARALSADM